MPVTPFHFGPNALIGLIFRKWLDLPVFVLANVVIDIEVLIVLLFHLGRPIHRFAHTLIGAGVIGLIWGLIAFLLLRGVFKWGMNLLRLEYKPTMPKMLVSGLLGAWSHALIDSIYNWDVKLFWPSRWRPWLLLGKEPLVRYICLAMMAAAIILYFVILLAKKRKTR